jgi:sulfatase modifying factor 1
MNCRTDRHAEHLGVLLALTLGCGGHGAPEVYGDSAAPSDTGQTPVRDAGSGPRIVCVSNGGAGASGSQPPSCQAGGPGLTDCGACRESCCESLEVPGGTYARTYRLDRFGSPVLAVDGGPPYGNLATVSAFRLDKYEVTVGRFRPFVSAWKGGWLPPAGSGKHTYLNGGQGLASAGEDAGLEYETGWLASDNDNIAPTDTNLNCYPGYTTWTPSAGHGETLPLNCVSWYDAYAFCIWDGGFLPSQAEWEDAAAGGDRQQEYPWGATDPGTANQYAIYGCYYPPGDAGPGFGAGGCDVAPVGTAALDWGAAAYADPCVDCANLFSLPPTGAFYGGRVAQGGDFTTPGAQLSTIQTHQQDNGLPAGRYYGTGFRCARAP